MNESNNLPQAISHKKLSFLLHNAQKDKFNSEDTEKQNAEKEFLDEVNNWESITKDLMKKISKQNDIVLKDKTSNSIMALGAMEVHLNMALQALTAFKKGN